MAFENSPSIYDKNSQKTLRKQLVKGNFLTNKDILKKKKRKKERKKENTTGITKQ